MLTTKRINGQQFNSYLMFLLMILMNVHVMSQDQRLKTVRIDDRAIQVLPADHRLRLPLGSGNTQTGARSVDYGLENTGKIVNVHGRWVQGDYAAGVCANLNAYGYNDTRDMNVEFGLYIRFKELMAIGSWLKLMTILLKWSVFA